MMNGLLGVALVAVAGCEGQSEAVSQQTDNIGVVWPASSVSYDSTSGLSGSNAQLALDNAGSRIATLEARAPVPGPEGPPGPQGPSGTAHLNWAQKSWSNTTTDAGGNAFPCCNQWHTIQESQFQVTTSGGALMVALDIQLNGGSHGTCQTTVDGTWAGDYSDGLLPKPSGNFNADIYWKEGLQAVGCCGGGWRPWRVTRIYPGIPAGAHTIAVQCATDGGTMMSCDGSSVSGCSIGVLELP